MIPIHISVRGVIFATAIVAILGILVIRNNSKAKSDYKISKGKIEFLEKKFQNLPNRDFGKFRYLKIESYPYLFEIYEPNSEKTKFTIDDLKRGDLIDIYYYETSDTRSSGINRFTQFIDRNSEPYFIRNGFQKQLGYIILILVLLINIMALIFWRKGKLNW